MTGFLLIALLGLASGSFATALTYRVPRGIPWIVEKRGTAEKSAKTARSACPSCGGRLTFIDLVPVFSWLFLRGRCRHCGMPISTRYPLIELTTCLGMLGVYACWGVTPQLALFCLAMPFLVALLFIDAEFLILPDQLVLILGILGAVFAAFPVLSGAQGPAAAAVLYDRFAGMLVYAGLVWGLGKIMTRLLRRESLGFGDVKFFAAAGLWLGFSNLPFFLISAGLAGVAWGAFYLYVLRQKRFPFGPALILALYAGFLLMSAGGEDFVIPLF